MAQVRMQKTNTLADNHYVLKEVHFELQKKDGSWAPQKRKVFDHGNAAAVLLYNQQEGTIILTRQFRLATYLNGNPSGMLLEACAGLLEENEEPEKTILREIEEETGYQLSEVQKVFEAYSSAGALTEKIFLYVAPYRKDQRVSSGGGLQEEGEDIEVVELSFEEVLQQLDNGAIMDAKTIILLQYARIKGLLQKQ